MLAGGCAAGKAYSEGQELVQKGDLDGAVAKYRTAVQEAPDNPNYKIALQRTMVAASRLHIDHAREYEQKDQLDAALGEYRAASETDPSNRLVAQKVIELEKTIRDRLEAARPKPAIQELRARARASSPEPILNPSSRAPIIFTFNNTSLRDILTAIGGASGINIIYDREVQDRPVTIRLDGVTLEQALNQILSINQLAYKVLSERSILIFPDTTAKHNQYDDQVVQTFYLSNSDATELTQLLGGMLRLPQMPIQPAILPNKTNNSITVRATPSVVQILEKIIEQNDKPRAEIVIDVEILEVDRNRAKSYGLELSDYAIGGIFSPEVSPSATTAPTTTTVAGTPGAPVTQGGAVASTTTTTTGRSTPPSAVTSPPPFNLNTISRGISTADFYLAVPTAVVRFLESDTKTRVLAKPQLRGAEGTKLTLKLGQKIPVVSTQFTPIATGGAAVNPLASYQYSDVGINLDITPRVTLEGDIMLDVTVDDSAVGADKTVAGLTVPTFIQRTVTTRLRLRDGESNLLAGLLQQSETETTRGFPGAIHVPILKQLFSSNNKSQEQIDVVMLLTPRIIRTQEIKEADLRPIYIGSQGALGVGGPPPLIAPPEGAPGPAAPAAAAPGAGIGTATPPNAITQPTRPNTIATPPPAQGQPAPGTIIAPPGSSPVPGTTVVQPVPPAPAPGPTPEAPAPQQPSPQQQPPPTTQQSAAPPPAPAPTQQSAVPPPAPAPTRNQESPVVTQGVGQARVAANFPGTTLRVGQGPYTVPISINGAQRISTITLTITFDPMLLRVRNVQEGSFMRTGGVSVTFTQQAGAGRVDMTISRGADATGASGTGLLAAIIFDAIGPGAATVTLSGAATGPGGTAMGVAFQPATVTVQQ